MLIISAKKLRSYYVFSLGTWEQLKFNKFQEEIEPRYSSYLTVQRVLGVKKFRL